VTLSETLATSNQFAQGLELLVAQAGEQGAAAQLVGLDAHRWNLDD
jgi:hypothetical protein